ncbi:MAG TPA: SpoIID/LytB domain-containing protein [Methylomirabilota bacterium]|jgi:stage II sporulation protein D
MRRSARSIRRVHAGPALLALAVALVAAVGSAGPARALPPIRIALADGLRHVEIGAREPVTVLDPAGGSLYSLSGPRILRVVPSGEGLDVVGARRSDLRALRFEARGGSLRVGVRDYVGALEVSRQAQGLLLVNELPMEEYVAGTVRGEASERWPTEALRALAVVARTYAVYQQGRSTGRTFHVVAGYQDQNFAGWAVEGSPAREAARTTAGQVLMWDGRVFPTFYHSDSGGFTEAPQSVFSGEIPPLLGVRDEFSMESPNYTWTVTIPLAVIGERLRRGGVDVGRVTGLTILERSPSFRVARMTVEHSRGTSTLRGADFRRLIGYDALKSTLFVPTAQNGSIRFEGRGWGHGVGLSQFGAKGMADRGYTYSQILAHYYPGTALATLR